MKVLVNSPTDLSSFLRQYGHRLRNVRAFYVVEPLLERGKHFKFGVAGITSGNAYHRVSEYEIIYGKKGQTDCTGVILHYLATTEYNPRVEGTDSQVYRVEKYFKQQYHSTTVEGRGSERLPISHLQNMLRDLRVKHWDKDKETILRTTSRLSTQRGNALRNDRRTRSQD